MNLELLRRHEMITGGSSKRTLEPVPMLSPSLTRVCVLVREKAGRAPVLCKTFSHVERAEAFIQERLASGSRQGFLVFWTLPGEPAHHGLADGQLAEVMVLVPEKKSDSVLQFAFPDVGAARAFVQGKFRGRDVTITWALAIRVSADERGNVNLSPSKSPQTSTHELSATVQNDMQEALSFADRARPCEREAEPRQTALTVEVRKVLAVKRWGFVPGAFAGFGSPPGRF